ncbi:MAG TPA: hypothetical protein VNU47_01335 [Candidatus Paceibacterota bacterium]|nr:hypothetical protein [Candidatus Paceibacterota bacterium]
MNDSERGAVEAQDHEALYGAEQESQDPVQFFASDITWRWIQVLAAGLAAVVVAGMYAASKLPPTSSH